MVISGPAPARLQLLLLASLAGVALLPATARATGEQNGSPHLRREDRRLAASSSSQCGGDPEPLIWRVARGAWSAYLVGSYEGPAEEVAAVPAVVRKALECADVAFHQLACSREADGGLGSYFHHCDHYPLSEAESSSISERLPSGVISNLQEATTRTLDGAAETCGVLVDKVRQAANDLSNSAVRTTLTAFGQEALKVSSPNACALAFNYQSYEDHLRELFGSNRPTFGLMDVGVLCELRRGSSTVPNDVNDAGIITNDFNNRAWASMRAGMDHAVQQSVSCGNLTAFAENLTGSLADGTTGPWFFGRLNTINPKLVEGIQQAQRQFPDKSVVLVVNVEHLVDVSNIKGVLGRLVDSGFTVDRLAAATTLQCQASTYKAQGAKELRWCTMPPGRRQPESCVNFTSVFQELLADHGDNRTTDETECNACKNTDSSCSCTRTRNNDTSYRALCQGTVLGDVSGQVFETDLVRNPGSKISGVHMAQKTVKNIFQDCYATSCDMALIAQLVRRSWYQEDRMLLEAQATVHPKEKLPDSEVIRTDVELSSSRANVAPRSAVADVKGSALEGEVPPSGQSGKNWVVWAVGVLLFALVAGCVAYLALKPRRKKKARSYLAGEESEGGSEGSGDTYEEDSNKEEDSTTGMLRDFARQPNPNPNLPPVQEGSILAHAMKMQQSLGGAGSEAVQQLQMRTMELQQAHGLSMPGVAGYGPPAGGFSGYAPLGANYNN